MYFYLKKIFCSWSSGTGQIKAALMKQRIKQFCVKGVTSLQNSAVLLNLIQLLLTLGLYWQCMTQVAQFRFFPRLWHRSDLYYVCVGSKKHMESDVFISNSSLIHMWNMCHLGCDLDRSDFPCRCESMSLKMWQVCILLRKTPCKRFLWALCWKYNQNSESSTQNEGLKDS